MKGPDLAADAGETVLLNTDEADPTTDNAAAQRDGLGVLGLAVEGEKAVLSVGSGAHVLTLGRC